MTTEQNITKKHCGLVVRSGSQPPWDLGSGGTNSSYFLCLHAEKISDLELSVAILGSYSIWNFSHRQSLHISVTGLNVGMLVFRNFHEMEGFLPADFSFM